MAHEPKRYFSNPYQNEYTTEQLIKILSTTNKALNQRVRTIRKARSKITGEKYEAFGAVLEYEQEVKKFGENRKTLPEKGLQKYSRTKLKSMIVKTETLLNEQTSTVRGIRTWENNRVRTFQEKGFKLTDKQFFDFFKSEEYELMMKNYFTSEILLEEIDMMRDAGHSMDEIYEAIHRFLEKDKDSIKDFEAELGFKRIE